MSDVLEEYQRDQLLNKLEQLSHELDVRVICSRSRRSSGEKTMEFSVGIVPADEIGSGLDYYEIPEITGNLVYRDWRWIQP